jgi:cytochrome P450
MDQALERTRPKHALGPASAGRRAPGPRAWPLIGNLGILRGLHPFLEQCWREHGDVFRFHVPGMRAVVITHPDQLQRVLVGNRHNYVKGDVYNSTRRLLGDGLLTSEGNAWRGRRTLIQPAFHRKSLQDLTTIMAESGQAYFAKLEQKVGSQSLELDVHHEMVHLTLDVVINALFGRGTFDSDNVSYGALNDALKVISSNGNGVQLPAWMPTPSNLLHQRTLRALDANVYQIIANARARDGEDGSLLSMLLATRDEQGEPLSDRAIRDEVITLFMAGHETTALTMTWLLSLMDGRPEVVLQMQEEIDQVSPDRDPGFEEIPKLVYVRKVVDETLRLCPPAPMVARNAVEADELGGFEIKAGEAVIPWIWAAHRHPDFWQEAERFDPERFTQTASKGRHPGCYLPFSSGPRICIGNAFSLIETVLLVAQLLRRFDVKVRSCSGVQPVVVATARPSRPVVVELSRRAGAVL